MYYVILLFYFSEVFLKMSTKIHLLNYIIISVKCSEWSLIITYLIQILLSYLVESLKPNNLYNLYTL